LEAQESAVIANIQSSRATLLAAALFVGALAVSLTYSLSSKHRYTGAFQFVCRQVATKHYFGKNELNEWYRKCLADKARVQSSMNPEQVADIFRQRFAELESSHLEIYSPKEDKFVWSGKAAGDNGIRTRGINGSIIVSKVVPKSSAEQVGVRVGDIILRVYGEKAYGSYPYNEIDGDIVLLRGSSEVAVKVVAGELQVDFSPRLLRLAPDVGLLEISSFRKEFFTNEIWASLEDQLQDFPSLIVDLRGNLGGDFNAVMKSLSFFMCEKNKFGVLERPAAVGWPDLVFKKDSNEDEFYGQLTTSKKLLLKRFDGPCFNGAVTVLIDGDTASVSEIFATVMKSRRQTRVWGEKTRGDLLLGVWYPLPSLAPGYTLSIPEAIYLGPAGEVVEGKGVTPMRTLFYRYEDAIRGRDSWVQASMSPY
jgi:carboxyl-terminal processing protease